MAPSSDTQTIGAVEAQQAPVSLLERVAAAHRSKQRRDTSTLALGRVLVIVSVMSAWQVASYWILDPFFFSSPSAIGHAFINLVTSGRLLAHAWYTVVEALSGYALGAVAGILAATILGSSPRLYAMVEPYLLALYSVPAVALAPLVIIWFGIGITPKILLAAYFVFFVVLMNGVTGFRAVPRGWVDVVRLLGATPTQLFFLVRLRAAASYFTVGLKAAVPLSVVGAMVGEFISAQHGMGYLIADSSSRFLTSESMASIFFLALLVLGLTYMLGMRPGGRNAL
jgi:NitT/TauT family transport system permease protein